MTDSPRDSLSDPVPYALYRDGVGWYIWAADLLGSHGPYVSRDEALIERAILYPEVAFVD